jgi:hypothetical protein
MVSELFSKVVAGGTKCPGSIPELRPWREVGWIFKDGGAIAIERQGGEIRMRSVLL